MCISYLSIVYIEGLLILCAVLVPVVLVKSILSTVLLVFFNSSALAKARLKHSM